MTALHKLRERWGKAWLWMPAITAFVLPLHPRLSAVSLILWGVMAVVGWALRPSIQAKNKGQLLSWSSLGPALYFMGLAIGMLWTEQMDVGWFALEVKSTLVILPILFWLQVRWSHGSRWIARAVQAFLFGLGAFMAWRLMHAAWIGDPSLWRYDGLAGPFHPSYIAAYLTMGMFLIPSSSKWRKPFLFLGALFVGLLASKAGWLVSFAVLGWMLVQHKIRTARWDLTVIVGGVVLVLGGVLGDQGRMQEFMGYAMRSVVPTSIEETSSSLPSDTASNGTDGPAKVGSSGGRMQAWKASWTLLQQHPFGVGTGDVVQELVRVYSDQRAEYAKLKRMNPHSAYWQALVTLGWFGGVLLLLWWGGLVWESIKYRAWNLGVFAAIILCHGVFESILELQQGVVAWVFLGLLLAQQGKAFSARA
ncbi:MAG: O-antigen ligase family protein [Bacteroidetes bacterium]|jgi:O-antigen ligase|nr:O-antigen ligase family protein [Bacteroidota bacterium]